MHWCVCVCVCVCMEGRDQQQQLYSKCENRTGAIALFAAPQVQLVASLIVELKKDTDLWQLLSSLQDVPQVTPSVTVRLQLRTQQVTESDATQAEPLLHPLALQRFP